MVDTPSTAQAAATKINFGKDMALTFLLWLCSWNSGTITDGQFIPLSSASTGTVPSALWLPVALGTGQCVVVDTGQSAYLMVSSPVPARPEYIRARVVITECRTHWAVVKRAKPVQSPPLHRVSAAELMHLHHLRSCAASVTGCRSTSASPGRAVVEPLVTSQHLRAVFELCSFWCQAAVDVAIWPWFVLQSAFSLCSLAITWCSWVIFAVLVFTRALARFSPLPLLFPWIIMFGDGHAWWQMLAVTFGLLSGVHMDIRWCRMISAAAAWELSAGSHPVFRLLMATHSWAYQPSFPEKECVCCFLPKSACLCHKMYGNRDALPSDSECSGGGTGACAAASGDLPSCVKDYALSVKHTFIQIQSRPQRLLRRNHTEGDEPAVSELGRQRSPRRAAASAEQIEVPPRDGTMLAASTLAPTVGDIPIGTVGPVDNCVDASTVGDRDMAAAAAAVPDTQGSTFSFGMPDSGSLNETNIDSAETGLSQGMQEMKIHDDDAVGPDEAAAHRRRLNLAGNFSAARVHCPVPNCPAACTLNHAGWTSVATMRPHLEEHAAGRLQGDIPKSWLSANGLGQCTVCSKLLSTRFGDACPRCRPALRSRTRRQVDHGRPVPDGWPSLQDIFENPIHVKQHVPDGARRLWCECLLSAMANVINHNDERAWIDLLALPKLVLCGSDRGGKKHRKRQESDTKNRCQRWLEGHRSQLWRRPGPAKRSPSAEAKSVNHDQDDVRWSRVEACLQEALLSKACKALDGSPPAHITNQIVQEMRSKHPAARNSERSAFEELRRISGAAAPSFSSDALAKALASFPRGSGPGPSGLRPQHLKDALLPGFRDELLRHAAGVANILVRGEAPTSVQPWLCGASLVALPKPDGTHRPIAVGEVWRRLVGKALLEFSGDDIRAALEPIQVGVGTSGGAEAIVHTLRQWLFRNKSSDDKVVATLDIENAFNTIDRSSCLEAVRRDIPQAAPWADFCYRSPSHARLGNKTLDSARGVQQGDPIGPAIFALALKRSIDEALAAVDLAGCKLDIVAFYLDDGTVAGNAVAVKAFCNAFREALRKQGLALNVSKCEVIPASGNNCTVNRQWFEGYAWKGDGCFKLLGAAFGDAAFCESLAQKRADKANRLLLKLKDCPSKQGALLLMRHCASWCKLVYSARTVPPILQHSALAQMEERLRATLDAIVGGKMADRSWHLAQLGVSQGGLGIRDPQRHAPAAYYASLLQTQDLCCAIDRAFDTTDQDGGLYKHAVEMTLRQNILEAAAFDPGSTKLTQKRCSGLLDAAAAEKLRMEHQSDASFLAHLSLLRVPGAGAWLTAPVTKDDCEMDSALFETCLRRRLRMPIFDGDSFCPMCGEVLDSWGDHCLTCSCGGDRTLRHNAVRDVVFRCATAAGLRPEREKAGLLPRRPDADGLGPTAGTRRPADIWVPRGQNSDGEAWDFAVTSALRADCLRESTVEPTAAFSRYESFKRDFQGTAQSCNAAGFAFQPCIFEAHGGGFSGLVRGLLDWVAGREAATTGDARGSTSLRLAQRISIVLHRETARAILRRSSPPSEEGVPDSSAWSVAVTGEAG